MGEQVFRLMADRMCQDGSRFSKAEFISVVRSYI
jgi:hypothetical protein